VKEKPFEDDSSNSFSVRVGVAFSVGSSGTLDSTLLVVVVELGEIGGGNALLGGVLMGGVDLCSFSKSLAVRTDFLSSSVIVTPGKKTYSSINRGVTAMA